MEAESLNIKLRLDLSNVTSGVKKVKTQLTGMAKSVKDSIPQIKKEGDKAEKSLGGVSTASAKVKKSVESIGKEAKDSIGKIYTESAKVASKLKGVKFSTGTVNSKNTSFDSSAISQGADEASESIGKLQETMQRLVRLDFFSFITDKFEQIKLNASIMFTPLREDIKYVAMGFSDFKDKCKAAFTVFKEGKGMAKDVEIIIKNFKKEISSLGANMPKTSSGIKNLEKNLASFKKQLKEINKQNFNILKQSLKEVGRRLGQLGMSVIQLITSFGKLAGTIGLALSGIAAVAGFKIANNTKEYREEQTKLNTAFQAAGASAEEASQAYNGLFRFLGKSDVSVEAANHLAKMTTNTKELSEWTTICQGIYASFGDSLPIEGLTEAANETIRTGKVVGVLADALNWAGKSEDDFNNSLAQTTSLQEREVLLRTTLNELYNNAAKIYEQNNKRIIEQNEAQARLNATMARIGQQTQVLVTSWTNLKNTLMNVLAPAIIYVSAVFSVLIDKLSAAIKWIGSLFGIKFDSISTSLSGISAGISGATGATDGLTDSLNGATSAAQKLKRVTMGFDELNIVTRQDTSSGGSGSGSSGGSGGGYAGLETGKGVLSQMGEQIEDIKKKVEAFFDKWGTQIKTIGIALGALGIAKLLTGLGKALGLGEKFLGTMTKVKKLAATAITIVLQYTLVNEFMDSFIDGEGFKEYLKGLLVSALGTGLLYAMWGPAGLSIGLGVTAVASIKAVIDNGGIDSLESAVVALTGVASAIGAIGTAWKTLNLGTILPAIGTTIKTHMSSIATFLSGSLAKISGVVGTVLTAIKTAVSSAISFIIANPIVLIIAAIVALVTLIAVKGDEIKTLLNKVSEWLKGIFCRDWREVFGNTIGTILNGFVKIVSDIFGNVKKVLDGIIDFIRGIFTGNWKRAWEGVKSIFSGVFGALVSVAKAPINGIIALINGALSAITSGLNAVKRALNKISVDIPSWVPIFGGKKFGFNFSMSSAPRIPMLANGGIATRSTIANIGEAGKEAILPLDRNTGWMDTLADRIAARNSTPTKVVLQVGERELGWATIGAINGITQQTGNLQLKFV